MISILIILLALLFGGFWVAFSLTGAGVYGLFLSMGSGKALNLASVLTWNYANSVILTAIPLFIFMGEIILRTGMGNRLYNGVSPWLRTAPGGLIHTNIAACALFSAITGSSVACAATIGSVAYPELVKRGYDKKLITGSLAAGGTLGILIPPSLAFIIYGAMIEESIGQLFIAGLIPGIMLALMFSATAVAIAIMNPTAVPREPGATWKERLLGIKDIWQVLFIMAAVLGGIYMGVMTPTEAAAIGAILALLMAAVTRTLTWKALKDSLMTTVHTTSMVLFIVIGAIILTNVLIYQNVPDLVRSTVMASGLSPLVVFIIICLIYLVLGCFFDGISMMVITLPVLHPVLDRMGFDPVWFGVILVILIEIGLLTPPVGINLFVLQSVSRRPVMEIARGSIPFLAAMVLMIVMLYVFPGIALWLPTQMMRR